MYELNTQSPFKILKNLGLPKLGKVRKVESNNTVFKNKDKITYLLPYPKFHIPQEHLISTWLEQFSSESAFVDTVSQSRLWNQKGMELTKPRLVFVNSCIRTAIAKYDTWRKQEKFIFLQYWRLDIQDQGVGWLLFSLGPLSLVHSWPPSSVSSCGLFLCLFLCVHTPRVLLLLLKRTPVLLA